MKLTEVLERWALTVDRSPRTLDNYRWALRRLAQSGITTLDDLTIHNVAHYVAERLAQVRAESLLLEYAAIMTTVKFLVRVGEARRSLVARLRELRPEVRKPVPLHARFHTLDEVERLLAAAKKQSRAGDLAVFTLKLAVLSGLRLGELAALAWPSVDLDRRVLSVRFQAQLGPRGRIKTMRERLVPMCRELRETLRARWKREGFVFATGSRASVNVVSATRILWLRLVRARERAGIPDATFLTLRHTRASWWVQAGVPIAKVASWLGHSPLTCSRFYIGILQGYDAECEKIPTPLLGLLPAERPDFDDDVESGAA